MPSPLPKRSAPQPHRPAVLGCLAFAMGIVSDHYFRISITQWLLLSLFFLYGAVCLFRIQKTPLVTACAVLIALFALGGARHHDVWSQRQANDILCYSKQASQTVRIRGIVRSEIEIIQSPVGPRIPSWMEIDRSTCYFQCEAIEDGGTWRPVQGKTRLDVSGHLVHVGIGDQVEVLGHLSEPRPPRNPGAFNFKDFLKQQGVDTLLNVDHPEAVSLVEPANRWFWFVSRWRQSIRAESNLLFMLHLSPESRSLAASILLGDRTRMTDQIRTSFTESGTMHLLAISGLHVGILVGLMLIVCRLCHLSPRSTAIPMLTGVLLFSLLTNHRPPVMRAALLATISLLGYSRNRTGDGLNTLATCALVLLLWKPTDLFDIGAQLSFLAVGAILWAMRWNQKFLSPSADIGDLEEESALREFMRNIKNWIVAAYSITGAIWLCTLPLTIYWFHLVAPIGVIINVLLIPLVAMSLSLGYVFLILGLLLPQICGWVGSLFDFSLQWLLGIVEFSHELPHSHFYLPGVAEWWLIGFYVLLALAWQLIGTRRTAAISFRALLLWGVLGLFTGAPAPEKSSALRCTFLSVGHGLCVVLELPQGETILLDAGTLGNGERAERIVERYLWTRNISLIDGMIVSHADHDHFNGVFGLMEVIPIRSLFISQQFLDFKQITVTDLCEEAVAHEIPIRIVSQGDQLSVAKNSEVRLRFVHPSCDFHSEHDNANSLVLEVTYAGRRILLTGDVEKDGLEKLTEQDLEPYDIFMAPHHGSKYSVSAELFRWAQPEYIIVSTNDEDAQSRLEAIAPEKTEVFSTANSGAITFEISQQGEITVDEFLTVE